MTDVPFLDLTGLHRSIGEELEEAIRSCVAESAFIGGSEVEQFEAEFASMHEAADAAGTNSGTDALALALRVLGVGPGDEVIVPSMTFFATAEAVLHVGATPVLADVDPSSLLLTAETVDAVRTRRTAAVIPVHLYGHVVDLNLIATWRADGLRVVEDAAQAHLASWKGRPVGTAGDASAFSFFPGKNLGAFGDAGAVVSDDPEITRAVRHLRDHGRSSKHIHGRAGWSSRMDGLQAAVLRVKLRHLTSWTRARQRLAELYGELLSGSVLTIVPWEEGAVHHLFVVRISKDQRDAVRQRLLHQGIGVGLHYPVPLHEQPALAGVTRACPTAALAARQVLSLPIDPLMSDDAVSIVVERLRA